MAQKTALEIVGNRPAIADNPPSTLQDPGRSLWRRVLSEYRLEDCGGLEMLSQCCHAADRAEQIRIEIEADGPVIRARGIIKDHPAIRLELAARAFVVRTLQRLGLDVEPLRAGPGHPPGIGWKQP